MRSMRVGLPYLNVGGGSQPRALVGQGDAGVWNSRWDANLHIVTALASSVAVTYTMSTEHQ